MVSSILDCIVKQEGLPDGSSRQVIRRELFKRAMKAVAENFNAPRIHRRRLSRRIAKDLWKKGERLQRVV